MVSTLTIYAFIWEFRTATLSTQGPTRYYHSDVGERCGLRVVPPRAMPLTALQTGRLHIIGAAALMSTYSVLLRRLYAAPGPVLPSAFVAGVRFQFTLAYALALFAWRSVSSRNFRGHSSEELPYAVTAERACPDGPSWPPLAPTSELGELLADTVEDGGRKPDSFRRTLAWDFPLLRATAELAMIGVASNFMTVWGVSRVPALTCEILYGAIHIFVPVETVLLAGRHRVGARTWTGCVVCFGSVVTLALVGRQGALSDSSERDSTDDSAAEASGGFVIVVAMSLSALGRVRAQHYLEAGFESEALNGTRLVLLGIFSAVLILLLCLFESSSPLRDLLSSLHLVQSEQWALLALSALLSAFLGSMLQYKGQRTVSAANAQSIYALGPLFAGAWCWALLREAITSAQVLAGALGVAGALLAATDGTGRTRRAALSGAAIEAQGNGDREK